jgi:phosphoribosylformylglycinamidine synthase
MITFFKKGAKTIYAVDADHALSPTEVKKLEWLLGGQRVNDDTLRGTFIGPRREMITPWSTNAVEITQNMAMTGIARIEEFTSTRDKEPRYDKMLQRVYHVLDGDIFKVTKTPDPIVYIDDIERYNEQEGLALSPEEGRLPQGTGPTPGAPAHRQRGLRLLSSQQ